MRLQTYKRKTKRLCRFIVSLSIFISKTEGEIKMIIEKEVDVHITHRNKNYYRSKGYLCEHQDTITVKIEDLYVGASVDVHVLCDICKTNIVSKVYDDYNRQRNKIKLDCCNNIECRSHKQHLISREPLENIISYVESYGYKFINTIGEYINCKSSIILECENGHQLGYEISAFKQGRRCSKCMGTYQEDHTYEEVYNYFKSQGCELLDTEYKTMKTPLKYKCSCGIIGKMCYYDFLQGHRCIKCGGNGKYEYTEVVKIFEDNNCTLLSTEYKKNKQNLEYICSCGNISKIKLSDFLNGVRCRQCYLEKNKGETHPCWNPDLSKEDRILRRKYEDYYKWRKSVYERDKYLCQCCLNKEHNILNAHHLDGFNWCIEKRTDTSNGITLCKDCHDEFHKKYGCGWNTHEQFEEFLQSKST
jgi:hypothetical protein